jgi:hypothetical protein
MMYPVPSPDGAQASGELLIPQLVQRPASLAFVTFSIYYVPRSILPIPFLMLMASWQQQIRAVLVLMVFIYILIFVEIIGLSDIFKELTDPRIRFFL